MNSKLKTAEELQQTIRSLSPEKKWDASFLGKVKLDFTFHNNKLENNTITYGQTVRYLKEAVTPKDVSVKDCIDIKNHFEILDVVFSSFGQPITESSILNLHAQLMKSRLQWDEETIYSPGKYKTGKNFTVQTSGKLIEYMEPEKVRDAIRKLLESIKSKSENEHPVVAATYFHNRILEIHPFEDGNGRICRIFTNMIFINSGYPPIFISDTERTKYLQIFEFDTIEKDKKMQNFFTDQLIESLKIKLDFINHANK